MKNDEHKNDIWIGDNKWIKCIDISGRYESAVNVDKHLSPILGFLESLETQCVAECCGFDAYDFSPEAICNSAQNNPGIKVFVRKVIEEIDAIQPTVIMSVRMNNLCDKDVFLQLLNHIHDNIIENDEG